MMGFKSSLLLFLVLGWSVLIVVHFSLSSKPINQSINDSIHQSVNQLVNQAAYYRESTHSIHDHSIHQSINQPTNRRSLLDSFKSTQHPVKRIKQSINRSINQPIIPPPVVAPSDQPLDQSTDQSINQPAHQSNDDKTVEQPITPPINQPTDQPTDQSANQPTTESTNQPTDQPANQPTDQSTNQPTDQPTNQPINPKLCPSDISPLDLYGYSVRVVDREDAGMGVVITVQMTCDWPDQSSNQPSINQSIVSPRAYFRLMAVGESMTSLDPITLLEPGQQSMTHFIRLPDVNANNRPIDQSTNQPTDQSIYSIIVKLMAYNMSDWMIEREWETNHVVTPLEVGSSRWFDRSIRPIDQSTDQPINLSVDRSIFLAIDPSINQHHLVNVTITPSQYLQHRGFTYEQSRDWTYQQYVDHINQLNSQSTNQPIHLKPLCMSSDWSLIGRWMLGVQHEHITHRWWSDSLWDDYPAIWVPYDCWLDQSASINQPTKQITDYFTQHRSTPENHVIDQSMKPTFGDLIGSLKWLSVIGDSNMRSLFWRLCELSKGEVYTGDPSISYMDLPKLCILSTGSVITYSSWFVAKRLPIYPEKTFGEQCTHYTEDLVKMNREKTIKGWPNCTSSTINPEIHAMTGPSLTYWGYGSHQAEGGKNQERFEYFHTLLNHSYFVLNPTIFALTEDVDVSMIPDKFGSQFIYRNNERHYAVNLQQIDVIRERVESKQWPVDPATDWLPVVDVFSPTHAASEVLHGDAVHFWWEVEATIVRFISHFIKYSPNMKLKTRINEAYAEIIKKEVASQRSLLVYDEEAEKKEAEQREEAKRQKEQQEQQEKEKQEKELKAQEKGQSN